MIVRHAVAVPIHFAKAVLRCGIAGFGFFLQEFCPFLCLGIRIQGFAVCEHERDEKREQQAGE